MQPVPHLLTEAEVTKAGALVTATTPMSQTRLLVPPGGAARQSVTLPTGHLRKGPSVGRQGVSMVRASYKAPSQSSQLNNPRGDRDADLSAEPDPTRRGHQPWHGPPSRATPLVVVNPGQQEEARQGESSGNRRGQQQVQVDDVPRKLQRRNRAGRRRRRRQRRRRREKQYFKRHDKLGQEREKGVAKQDPCASSSNDCGRQGGQRGSPVYGPQREQPGEACWQGHNWRRNQQQCTEPLHQDQEGEQSNDGQKERLLWNMNKCSWAKMLLMPAATRREETRSLHLMNRAGYCLPGMAAPHNTSQYIMDQHEYVINEEEAAGAMAGGSSSYSTADEDLPLRVPLPSTAQKDEGASTEEEEESTQPAYQH